MLRTAVILVGLALAGCTTTGTPSTVSTTTQAKPEEPKERMQQITLTPAQVKGIQAGVRRVLKDPDSARFGTMKAGKDSKGVISVCLLVNAKNSYGGYTGMKPYAGILAGPKHDFVVAGDDGRLSEYRDTAILEVCANMGLNLSV